jgi:hypothetical protein
LEVKFEFGIGVIIHAKAKEHAAAEFKQMKQKNASMLKKRGTLMASWLSKIVLVVVLEWGLATCR